MNLPPEAEAKLAAWREGLRRSGITSRQTLDELESHVRERAGDHVEQGLEPSAAVEAALALLGPPEELQREFSQVGTDRGFTHVAAMGIGWGATALMALWFCLPQLGLRAGWLHLLQGSGNLACIALLPVVLGWTVYHTVAWRMQLAPAGNAGSRGATTLRVAIWLTGTLGLLWWSLALDWILSLLATYALLVILAAQAAALAGLTRYTSRRLRPDAIAVAVIAATMISAAWTNWPTRLLFRFSRASLEALASRVEAGQSIDGPVWAGGFRIARTERRPPDWGGGTCLWVMPDTGLVRRGDADRREPGSNINRRIRLDERWYFVSED